MGDARDWLEEIKLIIFNLNQNLASTQGSLAGQSYFPN